MDPACGVRRAKRVGVGNLVGCGPVFVVVRGGGVAERVAGVPGAVEGAELFPDVARGPLFAGLCRGRRRRGLAPCLLGGGHGAARSTDG